MPCQLSICCQAESKTALKGIKVRRVHQCQTLGMGIILRKKVPGNTWLQVFSNTVIINLFSFTCSSQSCCLFKQQQVYKAGECLMRSYLKATLRFWFSLGYGLNIFWQNYLMFRITSGVQSSKTTMIISQPMTYWIKTFVYKQKKLILIFLN